MADPVTDTRDDGERARDAPVTASMARSLWSAFRLVALLAAAAVASLGVHYAGTGAPGRVDGWLLPMVDGVRPPWRDIALVIDFLGEPAGATMLLAAVVVGCLALRHPRAAVLTVAGIGATTLVNCSALKDRA